MGKKKKLSKRELLEEIYKNQRWEQELLIKLYNNVVPQTKDGEGDDLIGSRPPERP